MCQVSIRILFAIMSVVESGVNSTPLPPPPKSLKGLEKTMPCAYCSEVVSYVIIVSYSKDCYKGEYIV